MKMFKEFGFFEFLLIMSPIILIIACLISGYYLGRGIQEYRQEINNVLNEAEQKFQNNDCEKYHFLAEKLPEDTLLIKSGKNKYYQLYMLNCKN